MSTVVLVHGAWHGAWCWERLVPYLEGLDHRTVAMDLPIEDGSATFETYAACVLSRVPDTDDDVVLVGHSLGAMVIPLVAAARPASMVFLCPVVPNFTGRPWDDAPTMEAAGTFDDLVTIEGGARVLPSLEAAIRAFYHDCSADDAAWAYERLRPQNSSSLWNRPYPLTTWPDGRRSAIIGLEDRTVTPTYARFACQERLGVTPVELPGGHSPFLARPAALAAALAETLTH